MSLIETAKDVFDLVKKGATIGLQERLMTLREEALEMQEENLTLRTRVKDLEEKVRLREELAFDGELYWMQNPDGKREGPFCQKCYDSGGKLIRLQKGQDRAARSEWLCFDCESTYGTHYPE